MYELIGGKHNGNVVERRGDGLQEGVGRSLRALGEGGGLDEEDGRMGRMSRIGHAAYVVPVGSGWVVSWTRHQTAQRTCGLSLQPLTTIYRVSSIRYEAVNHVYGLGALGLGILPCGRHIQVRGLSRASSGHPARRQLCAHIHCTGYL